MAFDTKVMSASNDVNYNPKLPISPGVPRGSVAKYPVPLTPQVPGGMLRSVPGVAAVDGRPSIRSDLDVVELDDGLVVYDPENDRVHYLNRVAAMVFLLCTGEHSAEEMADLLARSFELENPPRADVEACLAQLGVARLLGNRQECNDD